ncbi:MAG TPA: 2-vinyl bacteriochlorophyllide hydratase [Acetobacteraceae bacterium]|nr:2-vinyl bacteriochlorophyllide hydratase [Acetobacteraceae bacterium]
MINQALNHWLSAVDACPWGAASGRSAPHQSRKRQRQALYTADERRRRDASPWTMVQAILAPLQFLVFLISLGFVTRFMLTGDGYTAAAASVVVKTGVLYSIMITGAVWEKSVFGRYLFAPAFFWEDVFSILVLGLHSAYLAALFSGAVAPRDQMLLALAAYLAYAVNATQFVLKLRAARREALPVRTHAGAEWLT